MTVDVSGHMGLGGVLINSGKVLHAAQAMGIDVALRFTSPTYAPSWGASDWLECYFARLGSRPDGRPVCDAQDVPVGEPPDLSQTAPLVWSALRIRDDIVDSADAVSDGPFAAVHFRGSDKMLDAPPVSMDVVFEVLQREMEYEHLERLFVASDEAQFVEAACAFFGDSAFFLPVEALATAHGRPPHFSTVAGETKAREALTTMLLLGRAKLLVKTESLLSDWATTLSDGQRVVRVSPKGVDTVESP